MSRDGMTARIAFLLLGLGLPCLAAESGSAESEDAFEHLPLTLEAGRLRADSEGQSREITDATAYCLSCHDQDRPGETGGPPAHRPDGEVSDHPVDLPYPQGRNGYRAAAELDPALVLLDGRVTCVTCHAHDDVRHGTVLPTDQSKLCRGCHLL